MAGYIGSKASVVSSGAERKKVYAITGTTTSLTGLQYTVNQVHVFHNGIRLVDGTDYTATNGTSITLNTAAENGDEVVVVSYASFQTSDTVSASAGGTFSNAVTVTGDLTVDTNTLYVDSTNNRVGIGTSTTTGFDSGADDLIVGSGSASTGMTIYSGAAGYGSLHFADANSSPANYVGYVNYNHSTNSMQFATNSTEAMRIDSSGNLLVGLTATESVGTNAGTQLRADGLVYAAATSDAHILSRRSTDGAILNFRKDTTTAGSIGTLFGDIYLGTGNTGLKFTDSSSVIVPFNTSTASERDNAIDLGQLTTRFDDVYATNGTIQTSDANEKQDIAELDEAEKRVAVAAKGLIRKYRWKDAVAEKGDDARIHVGIIAQDLQAAFAAEGLDAGRYAMFISSTWWEHEGQTYETAEEAPEGATERTRLGVRYPELLAFIIGAM